MNVKTYVHRYMKNRNIKLNGMIQTRNVARTKRRTRRILEEKKEKRTFEELRVEGMNFKIGLKKRGWEGVYRICLV